MGTFTPYYKIYTATEKGSQALTSGIIVDHYFSRKNPKCNKSEYEAIHLSYNKQDLGNLTLNNQVRYMVITQGTKTRFTKTVS